MINEHHVEVQCLANAFAFEWLAPYEEAAFLQAHSIREIELPAGWQWGVARISEGGTRVRLWVHRVADNAPRLLPAEVFLEIEHRASRPHYLAEAQRQVERV